MRKSAAVGGTKQLQAVFGAPLKDLTAAQVAEGLPKLEALIAAIADRSRELEESVKREAVDALGSDDGMARLTAMRDQLAPLQAERQVLQWALDAAREALDAKRLAEYKAGIGAARSVLVERLSERAKIAGEIDALVPELLSRLRKVYSLGVDALDDARSKLSAANARGLRLTATSGQGLQLRTVRHELSLTLCYLGGLVDTGGGRELLWPVEFPEQARLSSYRDYVLNWHADVLRDFDERYEKDHPASLEASATAEEE